MGNVSRRLLQAAVWLGLPVAGIVYFLINQDSDETAADGPANLLNVGSEGGLYFVTSTGDDGSVWGLIDGQPIDPDRSMRPRPAAHEAQWGNHR